MFLHMRQFLWLRDSDHQVIRSCNKTEDLTKNKLSNKLQYQIDWEDAMLHDFNPDSLWRSVVSKITYY